ncbi:Myb-like dna-binding protein, partial [Globisporangium polare]
MPPPRSSIAPSTSTSTATKRRARSSGARQPKKRQSSSSKTAMTTSTSKISKRMHDRGVWTEEEHDAFLVGIKLFPKGPWKAIADQVGSRSARQVQTHAQKYYEKVARRLRGLRKDRRKLVRPEHRLDDDMMSLCKVAEVDMSGASVAIGPIGRGLGVQASLSPVLTAQPMPESPSLDLDSLALLPVVASEPSDKRQVSSPMGVDMDNCVDEFDFELKDESAAAQSFMALLADSDSHYY